MEATEGMDKNIPLYIFALGSFVVTVFTIFWAVIKHTREADMVLHKRVNAVYDENRDLMKMLHTQHCELLKEVYFVKGKQEALQSCHTKNSEC